MVIGGPLGPPPGTPHRRRTRTAPVKHSQEAVRSYLESPKSLPDPPNAAGGAVSERPPSAPRLSSSPASAPRAPRRHPGRQGHPRGHLHLLQGDVEPSLSTPAKGQMACKALRVTGGATTFQKANAHADAVTPKAADAATPAGYGPSNLQSAYGLNLPAAASNGSGRDHRDRRRVRRPERRGGPRQVPLVLRPVGLHHGQRLLQEGRARPARPPPCPPVTPAGPRRSPSTSTWPAQYPNCNILLVEATSAAMANLGKAVDEAVTLGAKYISNSYGGSESSSDTSYDTSYFDPGVAITVSAGGLRLRRRVPGRLQVHVTSVGGTALSTSSNSRGWTESVWEPSGARAPAPAAPPTTRSRPGRRTRAARERTIADVWAVGRPGHRRLGVRTCWVTGVLVHLGGTSASSPIIAGVYALGGTPSSSSYPASFPYASAGTSALDDVTFRQQRQLRLQLSVHREVRLRRPDRLGHPGGSRGLHRLTAGDTKNLRKHGKATAGEDVGILRQCGTGCGNQPRPVSVRHGDGDSLRGSGRASTSGGRTTRRTSARRPVRNTTGTQGCCEERWGDRPALVVEGVNDGTTPEVPVRLHRPA